jgi:hypothetical protein
MIEKPIEGFFSQQPFQTHHLLPPFIIRDDIPSPEKEGKETDL